jgi:hypothetical protein
MIATTADISLAHMDLGYWALRMVEAIKRPDGGRRRHGRAASFIDNLPEEPENFAIDAEVLG